VIVAHPAAPDAEAGAFDTEARKRAQMRSPNSTSLSSLSAKYRTMRWRRVSDDRIDGGDQHRAKDDDKADQSTNAQNHGRFAALRLWGLWLWVKA
jgi:hypothetical protein